MDRTPDYSSYTYEELLEVHQKIDKKTYQDRFDEVTRLINDPEKLQQSKADYIEAKVFNKYSTFWPRFGAAFIDGALFMLLLYIEFRLFGVDYDGNNQLQQTIQGLQTIAYVILMHAFYGQTLGKMCMGVKVLNHDDEAPIGLKQSILRESVSLGFSLLVLGILLVFMSGSIMSVDLFISSLTVLGMFSLIWGLSEFITMLTNDKRRAIHDFIGKTVVVRVND